MKHVVKIKKDRLVAPIDFGEVVKTRRALGVALSYEEYGFMQTSGEVVVFDAYSAAYNYAPLEVKSGVIAFPFRLSCDTDTGERVAYCGLRFSDEPAVEWKPVIPQSEMSRLAVDKTAGAIPISSGVCGIATAEAYEKYRAHIKDEIHPLSGQIVLDGQTHTVVELFGSKYAVFSTGWGDGRYKCYAGYDKKGAATAVIVDFGMIEYAETETDETVEVEVEGEAFVVDPTKSERQNNIDRWTSALAAAETPSEKFSAYSRRGYAYHSAGDTENALTDYLHAIEACRDVTERRTLLRAWSVYDNAADIYIRKNDYESAIALMTIALEAGDDFYAGAFVRLIDLYMLTKRTDNAMEIAERMISTRPDDPVANMKYAEVCVSAMKYKEAARAYERLASEFRLYENLFDEASCLIELGDLDGAESALARHPAKEYNEQYWYYEAYIDYKKKRYTSALEKAERSHEIDEEYMPALYLLIDIHSIMQEYHSVAIYAEKYKKLRPDKEYGYSVCAEAHLILGNFSESAKNYWYLFEAINNSDKYAALAAITAAKMGDAKRKNKLVKLLRKKRSNYYIGVVYALYVTKYKKKSIELSRVVYNLDADADFLLQLAVYLAGTNSILPATHLLDALFKRNSSSYEIVAQQVRLAVKLGDERLFDMLFSHYIENYVAGVSESDRQLIAERFHRVGAPKHYVNWGNVVPETPEALGLRQSPDEGVGENTDESAEENQDGGTDESEGA